MTKKTVVEVATEDRKPMPGLTPGRMVHLLMEDGSVRAAVISEVVDEYKGTVYLSVFKRVVDDPHKMRLIERNMVEYSEEYIPGTWCWIEKV